MADHYDDIEQSEAVKKWLRDNGSSIILGAVVGLGGIFGWQYWQTHQASVAAEAAAGYAQLQPGLQTSSVEQFSREIDNFTADHAGSPYASLGSLQLAGKAIEEGDLGVAEKALRYAMDNGKPAPVATIARLRLARLLLSADRATEALPLLEASEVVGFEPLAAEIKGDTLVELGRHAEAKAAYEEAVAAGATGLGGSIQMKLNDLPRDIGS